MTSNPVVFIDLIKRLLANTRSASLAHIMVGALVYLVLQDQELSDHSLTLWFLCIIAVSATRIFVGSRHYNFESESSQRRFLKTYTLVALLIGVVWGALPVLQYDTADDLIRNFIFLVIIGLIGTGIATLTAWLPAFFAFMVPQALGLIVLLALQGDKVSLISAVGFTVYALLMAWVGRNFHQSMVDSLLLQAQKQKLIENLNHEINRRKDVQQELEEHRQQLEEQVTLRTRELVSTNNELEKEINERRKIEDDLKHLAHHDPLTSLPNRVLLMDRIKHAISISQRVDSQIAILFIDLDRFKTINDSLGHAIGDLLLKAVAERLKNTLRDSDTVARNGGDEFVVVLEGIEHREGVNSATDKIIGAISETFMIAGHEVHIGASIGIAMYPNDGRDPATLLKNADTAMYRGKQQNSGSAYYYSENMSQQARERLELENKLRSALDKNEFFMVYQPQVNIRTGKTIGFEALLRWHNHELGSVSPGKFVPLLEETGLIYEVGEWIVHHIAETIQTGIFGTAHVAINLSPLQCRMLSFAKSIRHAIETFDVDPAQFEFEITESLLVENFEKTTHFLNELHALGCSIALDDFGTGYTSMSYLARLPIDIIKIDRSFVDNIENDDSLKSIVTAILTMSHSLKVSNVIEGIETTTQLKAVQSLGGHIVQGFLYSRPLDLEAVENWLMNEQFLPDTEETQLTQ